MTPVDILYEKLPCPEISGAQRQAALAEAERQIKNYCHIAAVPEALNFTWANMAADLLLYRSAGETGGVVSGVKEGDTSVSFGKSGAQERTDAVLLNYRQQLQAFRKLRW